MPSKPRLPKRNDPTYRSAWRTGGTLVIAIVGLSVWYLFSKNQVRLSDNGYELSKSLYSACNLEDMKRLQASRLLIDDLLLTPQERQKMTRIVELAETGQWQAAASFARELLQSQDTP